LLLILDVGRGGRGREVLGIGGRGRGISGRGCGISGRGRGAVVAGASDIDERISRPANFAPPSSSSLSPLPQPVIKLIWRERSFDEEDLSTLVASKVEAIVVVIAVFKTLVVADILVNTQRDTLSVLLVFVLFDDGVESTRGRSIIVEARSRM
jgi:hypothetical protein